MGGLPPPNLYLQPTPLEWTRYLYLAVMLQVIVMFQYCLSPVKTTFPCCPIFIKTGVISVHHHPSPGGQLSPEAQEELLLSSLWGDFSCFRILTIMSSIWSLAPWTVKGSLQQKICNFYGILLNQI